jgi:hypothetical protein
MCAYVRLARVEILAFGNEVARVKLLAFSVCVSCTSYWAYINVGIATTAVDSLSNVYSHLPSALAVGG